jgi:hypothetical protein
VLNEHRLLFYPNIEALFLCSPLRGIERMTSMSKNRHGLGEMPRVHPFAVRICVQHSPA